MTISSTTMRATGTGDGANDTFAFNFLILDDDDLEVYVDGVLQTKTTHYTIPVAGIGEDAGGNVVFESGYIPVASAAVVMIRAMDLLQSTDYVPGDDFPSAVHERALDKLVMIAQMLDEMLGRCVQLAKHSIYSGLTLPDPVAGQFLAWNSALTGLQNAAAVAGVAVSTFMQTMLDDTDVDTVLKTLCLRQIDINITNADGGAGLIDVEGSNTYTFNGDSWTKVEDIADATPKGGITTVAVAGSVEIDAGTLLSGAVLAVLSADIFQNTTTTNLIVHGFVNTGDLRLIFREEQGTVVDLAAMVDQGSGIIQVKVFYITDA